MTSPNTRRYPHNENRIWPESKLKSRLCEADLFRAEVQDSPLVFGTLVLGADACLLWHQDVLRRSISTPVEILALEMARHSLTAT